MGWEPKIVFKELVKIMIDSDTELIGLKSKGEGISIIRKKA